MRSLVIFYFTFWFSGLFGQATIREEMIFYADVMITASEAKHRVFAGEQFLSLFRTFLESSDSQKDSLQELKWVSQLSAANRFRMFTWQIDEGNTYPCYGFIQFENGQFIELLDNQDNHPDLEYRTLSPKNWFGHLYYQMMPIQYNMDTLYMLFGYDANSKFNKRKVIEVLQFDENEVVFGKEFFRFPKVDSRDLVKYRVGFEYSADAVMSVHYNPEMDMIVFDHLQQVIGQIPGQGPTMVPDGTYEGLTFDGKYWIYNEKLFHEIMEEAPRPKPILNDKKKDILGRKN